jgi:hypothetical protein
VLATGWQSSVAKVERKGIEPSTSALRTNQHGAEAPEKPGFRAAVPKRCTPGCTSAEGLDSDLAKIVAAWQALPEPIRRAMLALIG